MEEEIKTTELKDIAYDTHLQEVCDTLLKCVKDDQAGWASRLQACKGLLEIEHLVKHGEEASRVIDAVKETSEKTANKALEQLKKLEPKQPWEEDDEED